MRVASTAVSIVPCPDIITTGIVSSPAARPLLEQRDAVGVGHPDVEQHEVGARALARRRARFARVLGQPHLVAFVAQDLRQQLADAHFVVDDQDLVHIGECIRVIRPLTCSARAPLRSATLCVTRAPRGLTFAIVTAPPCSSTIFFTMARPRPVPFGLLVTYGSKTRFMRSSEKPGAVVA